MKILYLRSWTNLSYSGSYSVSAQKGLGATETQMLLLVEYLAELGHSVVVYGVSDVDVVENDVLFKASHGYSETITSLKEQHDIDIVFFHPADSINILREIFPNSVFIQVCQNGPHFVNDRFIDIYLLVSHPQMAYYCVNFKKFRDKFFLIPNISLLQSNSISDVEYDDDKVQLIWIGSLNKQGFIKWAKAINLIMNKYENIIWKICVPSYDLKDEIISEAFSLYNLSEQKVTIANYSQKELAKEIKKSKIVMTSLGGEDAGVSYLDGHKMGKPVLTGNDIYGKYHNAEGLGLRCSSVKQCYQTLDYLLKNPEAAESMGKLGQEWVELFYSTEHQKFAVRQLLSYLKQLRSGKLNYKSRQSDRKFSLAYYFERIEIKIRRKFILR